MLSALANRSHFCLVDIFDLGLINDLAIRRVGLIKREVFIGFFGYSL